MSNYTDLLDNPLRLWDLSTMDPSLSGHVNNCPDTADAVDDFLNTGQVVPANNGQSRFHVTGNFQRRPISDIVASLLQLGPDHHYVIRGTRPQRVRRGSRNHFLCWRISGEVFMLLMPIFTRSFRNEA